MMLAYWVFVLVIDLLIPVTMIIAGHRSVTHPPKKIGDRNGCRTARSMQDQDAWDYAQVYWGRVSRCCGAVLLPLTVIAMLLVREKPPLTVSLTGVGTGVVQAVVFRGTLWPTELALKKKFDQN